MNYQTYEPRAELADFIKCYWTLQAPREAHPEVQRIVPDGCMELIFHRGDGYYQILPGGELIEQPLCFVFGQITRALEIQPRGEVDIFAVRFQPDGLYPFISGSISRMENMAVPLSEVFVQEEQPPEKAIVEAENPAACIALIEDWLLKNLSGQALIDRLTRSGVEIILQAAGDLKMEDLSEQMQLNKRQLQRKFSACVGLSPKQLAKIVRLQSVIKKLANQELENLSALAQEGNYYDQAHFIKDFKEFTGQSPKHFYANNLKMSQLFIESE